MAGTRRKNLYLPFVFSDLSGSLQMSVQNSEISEKKTVDKLNKNML